MPIKLIACDIDGTLVGHSLAFSPRVLDAVRLAQKRGIIVTIATGRGFPATRRFADQLGIDVPLICYQGAQIKTPAGETVEETAFPRQHLALVNDFCRRNGWELTVYYEDEIYHSTRQYDQDYYDRWFGLPLHLVDDLLAAVPGDPIKFIALSPCQEQGDSLEEQLLQLANDQFQILRSHAWFVEGLDLDVSKGNSLSRLAQKWQVNRSEVMAIGDSGNDVSMLEWAGVGVAMGNAPQNVKAAADSIAPTQDNDGAAWAIETYALGSKNSHLTGFQA